MEGYYWGKTSLLIPKVKCPRKLCSIDLQTFFNLSSYEEWYQPNGSTNVKHPNNDKLPFQLEPLSNEKWQVSGRFMYKGPTGLLLWFKPLYWAKSTWISTTEYSKSKQSTKVQPVTIFHPIGKHGKLYGILGLSNQTFEAELQFQPPFSFQIL
ncbi:hypothetical protein DSO57_1024931 [Entomophthora muscae]|uniref:Uncharacterized protein n=1 Tax=Entomophthora muscae TaxID=34485 RepID=A0ACC2UCC2_9FUNG|nr:hypothetical protein DSO57_1024931 [Entomophthora muscae]